MSDIRLYNLKNKKEFDSYHYNKLELQKIIEDNLYELLGVKLIASNINLTGKNKEYIESLGYDEDNRLVVIEYRLNKFSATINKGLEYVDFIRQNVSKVKVQLMDINGDVAKDLIYDPRLICIGEDYTEYDGKAIEFLPFDIDLIKAMIIGKEIVVLEKIYQNYVACKKDLGLNKDLLFALDDFINSLGDEVSKSYLNGCISYRRIRNFMYVFNDSGFNVVLKINNQFKKYPIKDIKDIDKLSEMIEISYDEN